VVSFRSNEDANCILAGVTITGGAVGIQCADTSPVIVNCEVRGNLGAGVKLNGASKPTLINCNIVDNGGDGIALSQDWGSWSWVHLNNCTVAGNSGTGVYYGIQIITNSIICNNGGDEIASDSAMVTYSNVEGGWPGEGNVDYDPCFADPCNGDYHLKSEAGRWSPLSMSWVLDDVTSRCIDAGNPVSDWTAELWPHGKRINLGAYGGTPESSMSPSADGSAADLNIDDVVDFRDFDDFTNKWRAKQFFLREDIDRNGLVDHFDLKALVDEWLWGR